MSFEHMRASLQFYLPETGQISTEYSIETDCDDQASGYACYKLYGITKSFKFYTSHNGGVQTNSGTSVESQCSQALLLWKKVQKR